MFLRIEDLTDEINAIIDKISYYCNKHEYEIYVSKIDYIDEFFPFDFELNNNPNKRRRGGVAKFCRRENSILLSPYSSQMIWYVAWLAYSIKNNHNVDNTEYFIQQLIAVDKGEDNAHLNQLTDWNSNELDNIFCYAMSFLICHEIGHCVYDHPGYSYDDSGELINPERLRRNELQADSFAADCILEISNNDETAKYGILVAQLAILFIREENVTYDTHPEPATRLENIRKKIDFTERMQAFIERANELSQVYLERRFVH